MKNINLHTVEAQQTLSRVNSKGSTYLDMSHLTVENSRQGTILKGAVEK